MGRSLGARLSRNIDRYTSVRGRGSTRADRPGLGRSIDWVRGLPERFRLELEGLSEGAGIPLSRVADWAHTEEALAEGCTSAIVHAGGELWVARNNDTHVPAMWGYITVREPERRNAWMSFCLEGDVFTPTGVNRDGLWLHYHYLSEETGSSTSEGLPPYAFIVEALETCRSLSDVECLLKDTRRSASMLLFAVSGSERLAAAYECETANHVKLGGTAGCIIGTNHRLSAATHAGRDTADSVRRSTRTEALLSEPQVDGAVQDVRPALISVLADDGVEVRGTEIATAYSCVACPGTREIWYTFGGWPAASRGHWARVPWPWS
jgi:hypothetical protein